MQRELELKYSSSSGVIPSLAELRAALEAVGYQLAKAVTREHIDTYYDDREGSLERHGLALRDRDTGGSHVATLKSRGSAVAGLHERDELELEAAHAPPPWPAGLVERIRPVASPQALQPRLRVATQRQVFTLLRAGSAVAELCFDEVTCTPPPIDDVDWAINEVGFNEVEIEALEVGVGETGVDGAELRAIGAALEELLPLNLSDISKLERASALLAPFFND